MENLTNRFIKSLYHFSEKEVSVEDKLQVKRTLTDFLSVTYAGSFMSKENLVTLASVWDDHGRTINPIGLTSIRTGLQQAILINGIASHTVELDDGDRFGMFHPGAPIYSALIPVVYSRGTDTLTFFRAVLTGYEASVRLARAMQPSMKEKGFHGTGICGTVGAAMAIAVVLNANELQFKNILSAALTGASGILKVIKDGSEQKPLNVGYAALSGYLAATIGYAGFVGPDDVLDGKLGFLDIYSNQFSEEKLFGAENNSAAIYNIYMKPYAACRHCHAAIDASINLVRNNKIAIADIVTVNVATYLWAIAGHEHKVIRGVSSAKMSIPYSVAVALLEGAADIQHFDHPYLSDKIVLGLAAKVEVFEDEFFTREAPGKRAASVTIQLKDGNFFSAQVDLPKGEPEYPVTALELDQKFISLLTYSGQSEKFATNLLKLIDSIDENLDVLLREIHAQ